MRDAVSEGCPESILAPSGQTLRCLSLSRIPQARRHTRNRQLDGQPQLLVLVAGAAAGEQFELTFTLSGSSGGSKLWIPGMD